MTRTTARATTSTGSTVCTSRSATSPWNEPYTMTKTATSTAQNAAQSRRDSGSSTNAGSNQMSYVGEYTLLARSTSAMEAAATSAAVRRRRIARTQSHVMPATSATDDTVFATCVPAMPCTGTESARNN